MTAKMEVFMAAITTIATVAAVAQLVITLPKASPRKTTEKTSWIRTYFERLMLWWLFGVFMYGIFYFSRIKDPTTVDISLFGGSVLAGAVWYSLALTKIVLRQSAARYRELQAKMDDLESRWAKSIQMHSLR